MARDDILFFRVDAFAVQDRQRKAVETEIANFDGNRLLNTNVDNLVDYIVEKLRIDVPELDEEHMVAEQKEAQRDVSGDPQRMAYFMDRPVYVVGVEVTVEVPFSGDPQLLWVRPNTSDSAPPRGEVDGNTLRFRYWTDQKQGNELRTTLDRWLGDVRRYLQWQRETFRGFNDALAARREQLSHHDVKSFSPIRISSLGSASRSNRALARQQQPIQLRR
jgi:hypothetical protein